MTTPKFPPSRIADVLGVVTVALALLAPASFAQTNLIGNPGFEFADANGFPTGGWWLYPEKLDPARARVFVDDSEAHSGKRSAKAELRALQGFSFVSPSHPVQPGDRLAVRFFYKSRLHPYVPTAADRAREAALEHPRQAESFIEFALTYRNAQGHAHAPATTRGKSATDGWERFEGEFVVSDGSLRVEMQLTIAGLIGELWWDDVSVQRLNSFSLDLSPAVTKPSPGRNQLAFLLENHERATNELRVTVSAAAQVIGQKTFTPSGDAQDRVTVEYEIARAGTQKLRVSLCDAKEDKPIVAAEHEIVVARLFETDVPRPRHVWPGRKTAEVALPIHVNLSAEQAMDARIAVELEKDGKLLKQDTLAPVEPAMNHRVSLKGRAAGTYHVRLSLLDKNGTALGQCEETFEIMAHPRPRIEVRGDRLFIEGKPIFPLGMFSPSTQRYAEYAAAGFNFVHSYDFEGNSDTPAASVRSCLAVLDQAREHGLWCIVNTPSIEVIRRDWDTVRERLLAFRDHPAVLCYMEEEQMARGFTPPEVMKKWHDLVRETDPDRPILLGDTRQIRNEQTEKRQFVSEWMDMGVWWWYPFPLADGQTEILIPDWLGENVRSIHKPIWVAPQSYRGERVGAKRFPTPLEYRCQAYLSIIHGAKGLMYFGGHIFQDPVAGHWDYLQKLASELRELSPVFLARTAKASVELDGSDKVSTLLKEYRGRACLIAANRDAAAGEVTFRLPFQPARVNVKFEDREIKPDGNQFKDTFTGYAVHVYEVSR